MLPGEGQPTDAARAEGWTEGATTSAGSGSASTSSSSEATRMSLSGMTGSCASSATGPIAMAVGSTTASLEAPIWKYAGQWPTEGVTKRTSTISQTACRDAGPHRTVRQSAASNSASTVVTAAVSTIQRTTWVTSRTSAAPTIFRLRRSGLSLSRLAPAARAIRALVRLDLIEHRAEPRNLLGRELVPLDQRQHQRRGRSLAKLVGDRLYAVAQQLLARDGRLEDVR